LKEKGFVFNNPNAAELVAVEKVFIINLKIKM
jgi:hypothetical protein